MSSKSMPEKMKLTLKGGGVVDPDSGVEDKTHVLKSKDALYSVVLGVVDIQQGRNSYYKIQVLEHDKRKKWVDKPIVLLFWSYLAHCSCKLRWYVFRSWGRVGTSIGDKKLTSYHDKQEAIEEFVSQYEDKTGNAWKDRKNFVKRPGKMYPLDIDYGDVSVVCLTSLFDSLPLNLFDVVSGWIAVEIDERELYLETSKSCSRFGVHDFRRRDHEAGHGRIWTGFDKDAFRQVVEETAWKSLRTSQPGKVLCKILVVEISGVSVM